MVYRQRKYPLFSACGLNCGLCPRYHTNGGSRCPGCAGEDFLTKHPSCGVLSCSQRHGVDYCCLCKEYPCHRYDDANLADSFITYRHQLKDLDKAKIIGLEAYEAELNKKIALLENLLETCDDGRRKSFFCIAVNLLDLQDIESVMAQIAEMSHSAKKEKTAAAVRLFQAMAEKNGIILKLCRKPS
jgi:hypothetical protein